MAGRLLGGGCLWLYRATFLALNGPRSFTPTTVERPVWWLSPGAACGRDGSGAPPAHSDLKISRYRLATTAVAGEFVGQAAFDAPSSSETIRTEFSSRSRPSLAGTFPVTTCLSGAGERVGGFGEGLMKLRIASLILATALLTGVLGGKAVAQFGWLFPGFNPQQ